MAAGDSENKALCILPWIHVQIRQTGVVSPCCRTIHPYKYGSVHEKRLAEIWNSEAIRKVRQDMLAGIKPSFCQDCHTTEDMGGRSYRQAFNEDFADELKRFRQTKPDGSLSEIEENQIIYLDLRFSNVCNFRCRSCNPENSNSWYEEFPQLPLSTPVDLPKTIKFVQANNSAMQDIEKLLPTIRKIYFAGGEPMLETQHYQVLERLIELGRTDTELVYNTNLSCLRHGKWDVTELWRKFDRVKISASIDAIGKPLELIRKGADWEQTQQHLGLIRRTLPQAQIQLYPTVSVLNCFRLPELISYFFEEGFLRGVADIEFNLLNDPVFLHVGILNEGEVNELELQYSRIVSSLKDRAAPELLDYIEAELKRIVAFARYNRKQEFRDQFRKFTFSIDKMRGERTAFVLPELLQLLYERRT